MRVISDDRFVIVICWNDFNKTFDKKIYIFVTSRETRWTVLHCHLDISQSCRDFKNNSICFDIKAQFQFAELIGEQKGIYFVTHRRNIWRKDIISNGKDQVIFWHIIDQFKVYFILSTEIFMHSIISHPEARAIYGQKPKFQVKQPWAAHVQVARMEQGVREED